MKTNDILLKFQSNNNKLETVLNQKKFSGDVKNLLLSMLYNITSSYNEYARIKVNVENKNKFVENIISIIDMCDEIELVKASSEEGTEFLKVGITSKVDTFNRKIRVLPTEKAMLFALFKMNDTRMYLDEKYNLIRVAFPEMLNEGHDINNIEIIRDFTSWSWNTVQADISNIDCNLVYQNLQILLGYKFLEVWMKYNNQKELIEKLEKEFTKNYGEDKAEKFLDYMYRLSIIVCTQRNKNEKQRLVEEREWDEKELKRLKDKTKLVEELTKNKKEKASEIKKIDTIINSEELLLKEFEERNSKLSEYKKIFSPEVLLGTLKKERKKALNEIEEANKLLDAKNYVVRRSELEKKLDLLKDIKSARNKEKYKIAMQKLFISCLEEKIYKINSIEQKKEAIALLHIVRYYKFIPFDDERFIKDVEDLAEDIDRIEGKLLINLYEIKALTPITKDVETDVGIIKPIFETRIMDFANINLAIVQQYDKIGVKVYDGDILELEFTIPNLNRIELKSKKKVKLLTK